jgi:hypothetical protein
VFGNVWEEHGNVTLVKPREFMDRLQVDGSGIQRQDVLNMVMTDFVS